MLTYDEIERLAEFGAHTSQVLSVYLDLDRSPRCRPQSARAEDTECPCAVFHRAAQCAVECAGRAQIVYWDAARRLLELGGRAGRAPPQPSPSAARVIRAGDQERQPSEDKE